MIAMMTCCDGIGDDSAAAYENHDGYADDDVHDDYDNCVRCVAMMMWMMVMLMLIMLMMMRMLPKTRSI